MESSPKSTDEILVGFLTEKYREQRRLGAETDFLKSLSSEIRQEYRRQHERELDENILAYQGKDAGDGKKTKLKDDLRDAAYTSFLNDPAIDTIVLVGGGPACGKTTYLNSDKGKKYTEDSKIVLYDTSLGETLDEEKQRIDEILSHKKNVRCDLIYCTLEEAAPRFAQRTFEGRERKPNPKKHFRASQNFWGLIEAYLGKTSNGSECTVTFGLLDNSKTPDERAYMENETAGDFMKEALKTWPVDEKEAKRLSEQRFWNICKERLEKGDSIAQNALKTLLGEKADAFGEQHAELLAKAVPQKEAENLKRPRSNSTSLPQYPIRTRLQNQKIKPVNYKEGNSR